MSTTAQRVPYYRSNGDTVERMRNLGDGNVTYELAAVIDPNLLAQGTPEEIAEAVAEMLDKADLARDKGQTKKEASYFHTATQAPGFRWV